LSSASGEYIEAASGKCFLSEPRFSDAGLAGQDHRAATTPAPVFERALNPRELRCAPDEFL
jgi:hypothetical protein